MTPTLKHGRIVILTNSKPRVSSVCMLMVEGREVLKRVTALTDEGIFVEGDNKIHSTDSRTYGHLDFTSYRGTVIFPRNL